MYVAFDIETDTSAQQFVYPDGSVAETPAGLDPRASSVLSLAVVAENGWRLVMDAPEARILETWKLVCERFADDTFVSWNGTGFDLPFLSVRMSATGIGQMELCGFDPGVDAEPKYGWPEWATVAHEMGKWGGSSFRTDGNDLAHLDIAPLYKQVATELNVRHSLKPVGRAVLGVEPVEVDASQVHLLSERERLAYVASDAELTLQLALHLSVSRP